MFTGIVETVGLVVAIEASDGDRRLRINTAAMNLHDVHVGDSIATNGVCLTVVDLPGDGFWADVSAETLGVTTIATWQPRMAVNLEKALTPSTPIGGHIVSGHVDGVAKVVKRQNDGRSQRFTFKVPLPLTKYIAQKGSITLDGVSLTVNTVDESQFDVNIVPHTWANTIMMNYQQGTLVNMEVDLLARYVERLVCYQQPSPEGLTTAFLQEHGFLRK
jgi:riboflavin synthase